ncbi:STM4015 family protein [Hamadaea tsunoensis]|uniref:STM4015 family protein n=1 Tax=Hamadaea tsunoensis TaxID=53368 RepID=UPI000400CF5E|nr:STM4015 family protein [Hamadaea tsunoensis]
MAIAHHITTFAGLPVVDYPAGAPVADPAAVAWRIDDPEYDGSGAFEQHFSALLAEEWAGEVTTLVIGNWGSSYDSPPPVDRIAGGAARLTSLRALFLGEITFEECEISWIQHTDITPIFEAYPGLVTFTVRGGQGLLFKALRHTSLRSLTFQAGGLGAEVVRAVGDCDLPELTHLELWLGTSEYGGSAIVDDLAPILAGSRLPKLTALGLKNAEIADEVAAAVAFAPVVARLEELDMSMGVLTDTGAAALLAGQPLTHLRRLDLHHHYLTEPVMRRLTAELAEAGVAVDLSELVEDDDGWRYVSVAE